MTHEVIRHLLDDYVAGELPEDARPVVSEHVTVCEICRGEVEALERIIRRAADLPQEIDPPADAWLNIRAAIEHDKQAVSVDRIDPRRGFWQRPYVMAAAVVLVAVLSSATTAIYLGARNDAERVGSSAVDSGSTGTAATLAAFTIEENTYLRNVAVLQDMLDQQEATLAPETVAQLKSSLRTIDEAILEARNALARDPANKTLIEMLSGNYRQKVDLMRRTTELARGS
jgi:anti-sigma-K factor RskA